MCSKTMLVPKALNRLMHSPGAEWTVASLGAVGTAALLTLAVWQRNPSVFDAAFFKQPLFVFPSLWSGVFGWLGVKSWQKLWRSGDTPIERVIYETGVRGWGGRMLAAMPLACGVVLLIALPRSGDLSVLLLILACVYTIFITGLSLFLWIGFAFGSSIAGRASLSDRKTRTIERDDHPH